MPEAARTDRQAAEHVVDMLSKYLRHCCPTLHVERIDVQGARTVVRLGSDLPLLDALKEFARAWAATAAVDGFANMLVQDVVGHTLPLASVSANRQMRSHLMAIITVRAAR